MRVSGDVIRTAKEQINAALTNEQLTRQRVEALEGWAKTVSGVLAGGFRARLWWILTGK